MRTTSLFMSILLLALALSAMPVCASGGPGIGPAEAGRFRGQLVTLTGPVTTVQTRVDGLIITVGSDPGVSILVPESTRPMFRRNLTELHDHRIQVTGFITANDQPLAMVLARAENLIVDPPAPVDLTPTLLERVQQLELALAQLEAVTPLSAAYGGGSVSGRPRRDDVVPAYATYSAVRAMRGIPMRVETSGDQRALVYPDGRYVFDDGGQLLSIRRD